MYVELPVQAQSICVFRSYNCHDFYPGLNAKINTSKCEVCTKGNMSRCTNNQNLSIQGKSSNDSYNSLTTECDKEKVDNKKVYINNTKISHVSAHEQSVLENSLLSSSEYGESLIIHKSSVSSIMCEELSINEDIDVGISPFDDLIKLRRANPRNPIISHVNINSLRNKFWDLKDLLSI